MHPSDAHPHNVAALTSSGCMGMLALPNYADDRHDDLDRSLSAAG
jgi:hypothetical protein